MTPHWQPGETVVERFLRPDGSAGQHHPLRTIADDGRTLLAWIPRGTEIIGTRLAGGRRVREAPLQDRFRLPRESFRNHWRDGGTLRLISEEHWSSIWWFFNAEGEFVDWYANLEIPCGRTATGPDRIDGVLDVVVHPDRSWRWKDEDEAEAALAAGRLTGDQLVRLRAEGARLIALAEAGAFPFDGTWTDFRPDPAWPAPELPASLLEGL
ncbi:DUF402 domain-containing protein [Amycolatopsis anabasis]|uniref:DUF402 domain-containing protein n=1 Tax=Amycolatopsis anabasis TaxID=1840409 RepID=UPI001FE584AD|nr:DUF402 domain-containing protein [Amycolatopsis anabasis]